MTVSQSAVSTSSQAARELGNLLATIQVRADWRVVETTAQSLANALRNRGGQVDEHTALGKTLLPQTLTHLLTAALEGSHAPDDSRAPAVLELLRVGANICMDHNENRGHLLDAGFPKVVVELLDGYAERLPEIPTYDPLILPDVHLKIIRTAVGALLNLSLGYEPIQMRLISDQVPMTLLRLSMSVYPPGGWLSAKGTNSNSISADSWLTRKVITDWTWRAISGLKDNQIQQPLFGTESLPYLVLPLKAFVPPFSTSKSTSFADSETRNSFFATDVEVLDEACELIEALTIDVEDVRLALASGMAFDEQPPVLAPMLDFIESAEYLPDWQDSGVSLEEVKRWKHVVDLCKAAIIRSVVEVSGEEGNADVLWDDAFPENAFISRSLKWLRDSYAVPPEKVKDDIVICATLSLGNLVRREGHSVALVNAPISITPYLVKHLTSVTDLKVKHGVIGLLKHLAQSPSNRTILGEARVIELLRTCGVFTENSALAEVVQMSSINLAKHLCNHNVLNSVVCVLDTDDDQLSTSCLSRILTLSRRSDKVPIKSESARVLVNVIKSLCSTSGELHESRRQDAVKAVTNLESATTLARLLGRSKQHVMLLHEAIVSMLLIAVQPDGGAVYVLDAVVAELPKEVSLASRQNSLSSAPPLGNTDSSSVVSLPTALEVLVWILRNEDGGIPGEVRANLCQLLGEIGRESLKSQSGGREAEVERVRVATRQALEMIRDSPDSLSLSAAARKTIEAW